MRVLAIAPEFTSLEGGAGIYISELARGFPEGSEMHIVTSESRAAGDVDAARSRKGNLFIHRLRGSTASLRDDLTFKVNLASNLRTLVRESDADVILSSSRMPDILCRPMKAPAPIVATVHSTIGNHLGVLTSSGTAQSTFSSRERFLLAVGRLMVLAENRYYKSGRHFICVSEWGKRDLMNSKGVDPSRISVVPNGVDLERFSPALRTEPNRTFPGISRIDSVKVLYAGRFTFAKGFFVLLKMIELAVNDPRLHFVIAGSGQHAVPHALLDRCTVLGKVSHRDMPQLYAACDVLVVPSLYENMPLTVLEAMASGCVPIASDVGGIAEVVDHGKNGILVAPGNPTALIGAIQSVSQDSNRMKTMARSAREKVAGGYGIDRMVEASMTVLEKVCLERAGRQGGR